MMDITNDEHEQLQKKIMEFISNTISKNINMKRETDSVQNSALVLPKEREMVYNTF